MAVVPFPAPTIVPADITLVNAQATTSYTSNTWVVPPWTLVDGSFPSLVLNVSQNAYVPYNNFSNFPTSTQIPTNITATNAKVEASYTTNTWVAPPWTFNASQYPSMVLNVSLNPYVAYNNFLNFPTPTQQPGNITNPQSRTGTHYSGNTWNMGGVWGIKEAVSRPRLLTQGFIDDPALTTRKSYVFIVEDEDGSLYQDDAIWKSTKQSATFDSTTGTAGALVTHVYGGPKQTGSVDGKVYVFKWSGVQDPTKAGGYGFITTETERTVAYMADRSNNAVFYYGQTELAAYDYLLRIATTDLLFHIVAFIDDVSSIRVVMADGVVATLGLVEVGDPEASPIRVMTPTGIMALQFAVPDPDPDLRSGFAVMSNYSMYSNEATQAEADNFIDSVYGTNKLFKVITLSSTYIYIFTTTGTYINVDFATSKITSDGTMYSCEWVDVNRNRGMLVDWSSFGSGVVEVLETYVRP